MSESSDNPVLVVTGAAGFVGHALLRELAKPDPVLRPRELRLFDRKPEKALERPASLSGGRYIQGDVRKYDELARAFEGADAVIHLAAIVDWGQTPESLLESVNVKGAETVVRACVDAGVRALVSTASTNVVWNGRPLKMAEESVPYPTEFQGGYARTKAMGEQIVLAANGTPLKGREGKLRTCTLRPGGIYGERDPYETNQLLKMARLGALAFRMGDGSAAFSNVYVGNVAHQHLLAARELLRGNDKVAGQAYFTVDHPAKNFIEFFEPVIRGMGYYLAPPRRYLPTDFLMGVGAVMEKAAAAVRPVWRFAPAVTRTSVALACKDYTFSGAKAERDLGYKPVYSEEEALARTLAWFKEHGTT